MEFWTEVYVEILEDRPCKCGRSCNHAAPVLTGYRKENRVKGLSLVSKDNIQDKLAQLKAALKKKLGSKPQPRGIGHPVKIWEALEMWEEELERLRLDVDLLQNALGELQNTNLRKGTKNGK